MGLSTDDHCLFINVVSGSTKDTPIPGFPMTRPADCRLAPPQWGILSDLFSPSVGDEVEMKVPLGLARRFDLLAVPKVVFGSSTADCSSLPKISQNNLRVTDDDLRVDDKVIFTSHVKFLGTTLAQIVNGDNTVNIAMTQSNPALAKNYCMDSSTKVLSIIPPQAGNYGAGDDLVFKVLFDRSVDVTATPKLIVKILGSVVNPSFSSGSGTPELIFTYTVGANDIDPDGIEVGRMMELTGGAKITDPASDKDFGGEISAANIPYPNIRIDTARPTVVAIRGLPTSGTYTTGDHVELAIEFSEPVANPTSSSISIALDSGSVDADWNRQLNPSSHVFRYTVQAGDNVTRLDLSANAANHDLNDVEDLQGNALLTTTIPSPGAANGPGVNSNIKIDTTAPELSGSVTIDDYSRHLNRTTNIQFTGSASGASTLQIAVGNAQCDDDVVPWVSVGSVGSFNKVLTGLSLVDTHSYFASVRAIDAAGNISTSCEYSSWVVDAQSPVIQNASISRVSDNLESLSVVGISVSDTNSVVSLKYSISTATNGTDILNWQTVAVPDDSDIEDIDISLTSPKFEIASTYHLNLIAVDDAGNESAPATIPITTWNGGTWTPLGGIAPAARTLLSKAAYTASGKYFVWGGYDGSDKNTGALYDPTAQSWTTASTTNAPAARREHATIEFDGDIFVFGGTPCSNTGAKYDGSTNSWSATANAPIAICERPAYVVHNDRIYIWGANIGSTDLISYDTDSNTWTTVATSGTAPTVRNQHSATLLGSKLYIWGGYSGSLFLNDGAYADLSLSPPVWTAMNSTNAPTARGIHQTALIDSDKIIYYGGWAGVGTNVTSNKIYNTDTNTWSNMSNSPLGTRMFFSHVWTGSRFLVWGGTDSSGVSSNTGASYNPETDTWAPMLTPTLLPRRLNSFGWNSTHGFFIWGGDAAEVARGDGAIYHTGSL